MSTQRPVDVILNHDLDFRGRKIYFNYEVDEESAGEFVKKLHMLEKSGDGPIEVWLNSVGGMVSDGLMMYDALRSSPCEIRMIAHGQISSMATIIFLAGDERIIAPHCEVMIHPISDTICGSQPDIDVEVARLRYLENQMLKIYTGRTRKKRAFWKAIKRNRYLSIEECCEMGFADSVIGYSDSGS